MEIYLPQVPNTGSDTQSNQAGYTVQPGDTLESIAAKFGVDVDDLIAANFKDGAPSALSPGQEINIPVDANATFTSYTAQGGDSKESVAAQFDVPLTNLLRANPSLANAVLLPGFLIKIPQLAGKEQNNLPEDYTMKLGDTLAEIAKKHGISAEKLQKANPQITDINKGFPGTLIKFPKANIPKVEATETQIKAPVSSAAAFDSFSKLRFQMMGNPIQMNNLPGLGINQNIPNQQEDEQSEQNKQQRRRPNMPAPFDKWSEYIYLAAEKYNLEASLIAAVIWCESAGNNIIGKNGHGHGLMQIDDRRYNDWLRQNQQGLDPASNIDFGCSILRECLDSFKNDNNLALAAYCVGIEPIKYSVTSQLPNTTGSKYAFDVLSQKEYFKRFFEN